MADRTFSVTETIVVRHVAEPLGHGRENGPHLGDLRAFVAACDGLADDVLVRIDNGQLDEGARRRVTFTATVRRDVTPESAAARSGG